MFQQLTFSMYILLYQLSLTDARKTGFQIPTARLNHVFCLSFSSKDHYYADIMASLYVQAVAKEHSKGELEHFKPLHISASS